MIDDMQGQPQNYLQAGANMFVELWDLADFAGSVVIRFDTN